MQLPKAVDIFCVHEPPPFPFPTLWSALGGLPELLTCLPSTDVVLEYMEFFRRRAQCAYPFIYTELQDPGDIMQFLQDRERSAVQNPSMLALIYIAMALGVQCSVYARNRDQWLPGCMEKERRTSEVFRKFSSFNGGKPHAYCDIG